MRTLTYYAPQYVSDVATPEFKIVFGAGAFHLESVEGLGAPDTNTIAQGLPLQNGAQFSRMQYQPRIITIEGKMLGTITAQNTNKAVMSKALAFNNLAVRESWMADFWRLRASDSGIDSVSEFVDFLFNVGGLGVLKYTSDGITITKRINAIPNAGPLFKNKDGREPYQAFQVSFYCPAPFWEDDEYTLAVNETDDVKTVDFTISGDVAPRMVLHVEPTEATVSNSMELTVTGKQNYTPGIAAAGYVPTMIDMKSTASLVDGDMFYQSFCRGELQSYIDRSANNIFVAVGASTPYIATSVDGLTWVNATSATGTYWRSITYSSYHKIFVAVGQASPYIAYSTDGKTWAAATTVVGTQWFSAAYSDNLKRFVTVGNAAPTAAYSDDAVNWSNASSIPGTDWFGIARSDSLGFFVAVGASSPYMAWSTSGITWFSATTAVGTYWNKVVWSETLKIFVAVGDASPYIAYSADGKNWIAATSTVGTTYRNVAWSETLKIFVAVGNATPYIAYSADGKKWAAALTVVGTSWSGISWSPVAGVFSIVGTTSPYIAYSADGKNWAAAPTVVGTSWLSVISVPSSGLSIDTNASLTRFKAIEMPPGAYRVNLTAQKVMVWKLYYRKAWLGV